MSKKKNLLTEREIECVIIGVKETLAAKKHRCKNCRYWREKEYFDGEEKEPNFSRDGNCQRYAPKCIDKDENALWPWTGGNDWCGEFKPKS